MDTTKDLFIIAVSAADDAVMYPISRLLSIQHEDELNDVGGVGGSGDDIVSMYFEPVIGDAATGADREADIINITVANETERATTLEIIEALNSNYGKYRKKQANSIVLVSDVATHPAAVTHASCAIIRNAV